MTESRQSAVDAARKALNDLPPDVLTAQTALAAERVVDAVVSEVVRFMRTYSGPLSTWDDVVETVFLGDPDAF